MKTFYDEEVPASSLISDGDSALALHFVDRWETRIDVHSAARAINALRYWIGEHDRQWSRANALEQAIARSECDLSTCRFCDKPVVCIPDGLPCCMACGKAEEERQSPNSLGSGGHKNMETRS